MTTHDQHSLTMTDPLWQCGHYASDHADAGSGDTRCLALQARDDLIAVFDDGRGTDHGLCACLRFTPAHPAPGT